MAHIRNLLESCTNIQFKVVKNSKHLRLFDASSGGRRATGFGSCDHLLEITKETVKVKSLLGVSLWSSREAASVLENMYA